MASEVQAEGAVGADQVASAATHADSNAPADGSDRLTLPPYRDARFYQRRKKNAWREVPAPDFAGPAVDTHCHLHMLPDPALELARMAISGVTFAGLVTDPSEDGTVVFDSLDTWIADALGLVGDLLEGGDDAREGAETAEAADGAVDDADAAAREVQLPHVRITAGVHPHNASSYDDALEARLVELLSDLRVSALGEIGLDYHYDFSPRDVQRRVFRRQIQLAHDLGLPIALHIREAHDEALEILREEGFPEAGTLLHCCALSAEELKPWIDAGCYIAYGGALTFKKADAVREACALVPADRLLTETDAPYMTPEPMRGVACTPAHVVFTADMLTRLTGVAPDRIRANALALLDRENPIAHAAHMKGGN